MLIALFAPQQARSLEIAGARDLFAEANGQSGGQAGYDVRVITEEPGPLTCASGLQILPDGTIHDPIDDIDTLILSGSFDIPGGASPALISWIQRVSQTARRYGSFCTGAFLLGMAGLLDGKQVTTHWERARNLAATFPSATVDADRIFVRDGRLFTSAGVSAALDLSLALIEDDHGRALALAVARNVVMFLKRPGGQSQFSVPLAAQMAASPPISQLLEGIAADPTGQDLSIPGLARRAGMSERNFSRLFRRDTGMTPAEFVDAMRVETARRLLEETSRSLKSVAVGSGFSGPDALRRAFIRRLGVTPVDYRERFRTTN